MAAFPALNPQRVVARRLRAQSQSRSPFTFKHQVYDWGGEAWHIVVTMQRMTRDDAAIFFAWLDAQDGINSTFTFNLDRWVPGISPAPGDVFFRLVNSSSGITSDFGVVFDATFEAIEEVPST